jgi:hypothetical protein
MTSDDGRNNFNGFILCNKFFQENFSIGLSHNPKEEKGTIVLLRINGLHGGTKVHPHHSYYHIHLATAERINNGLKSEGKIIETTDYSSFETAIQYFIRYIGLDITDRQKYFPPPSSQIDLNTKLDMEELIKKINENFNNIVKVEQKRPNIFQIYLPLYHEDGDMIDIFIEEKKKNSYSLCDFGLTLQRLSYSYDIDTANKEDILQKIITENSLSDNNGNISINTSPETVFGDIMHLTEAYAKIGSMRYFKREVIESLFYEMLDEFIDKELQEFLPSKKVYPIADRDDLEADYQFLPNGHPVYLFGVKDVSKARLATISCLEYQKNKINFKGWVVNEDFEKLPRKDRLRLTNVCDKQYTSLNEFKSSVKTYLERERSQ